MSKLIHLIYASAATHPQSDAQLEAILQKSRANNVRDGVTGMLLYADGSFFQVLEGPAHAVDAAFARIDRDARHRQTTCIIREPISRCAFDEWSMGYAGVTPAQLASIVGMNDFFADRQCMHAIDPGRARKLLQAFGTGRWRTRVASGVAMSTGDFAVAS